MYFNFSLLIVTLISLNSKYKWVVQQKENKWKDAFLLIITMYITKYILLYTKGSNNIACAKQ